jgi:hypothetical protein
MPPRIVVADLRWRAAGATVRSPHLMGVLVIERRDFLQQAAMGLAGVSALSIPLGAMPSTAASVATSQAPAWDLTWATRLTGKHKAVFDVVEVESGFGVFRASAWAAQYMEVVRAAQADLSPVIVLRANAVVLALQQSFWDQFDVGRMRRVTHPVTLNETSRNPVLLTERDGLPAPLARGALQAQMLRGATVLACDMALQSWIDAIRERRRISADDARTTVVAALVPGVILQPSGVFAATYAQERGCAYLRAS